MQQLKTRRLVNNEKPWIVFFVVCVGSYFLLLKPHSMRGILVSLSTSKDSVGWREQGRTGQGRVVKQITTSSSSSFLFFSLLLSSSLFNLNCCSKNKTKKNSVDSLLFLYLSAAELLPQR